PVFEGEKYVSLAYKYSLADEDYTLLIMNEPVCVVEYMQDGSSTNMYRQYLRNPNGFAFIRKVDMNRADNFKELFRCAVHYVSSSIIAHNKEFLKQSPKKGATVLAIPFGAALTAYIKYKSKGYMNVNGFNEKKG
ncbi:MAG: glycosyltransferase family 2 protein, partial [Acutalibacteraceae bacterium]